MLLPTASYSQLITHSAVLLHLTTVTNLGYSYGKPLDTAKYVSSMILRLLSVTVNSWKIQHKLKCNGY